MELWGLNSIKKYISKNIKNPSHTNQYNFMLRFILNKQHFEIKQTHIRLYCGCVPVFIDLCDACKVTPYVYVLHTDNI